MRSWLTDRIKPRKWPMRGHSHQACTSSRDRASGARINPQGMVPGCHNWPPPSPGLARCAGLRLRSNRRRLPCVSHRPCRITMDRDDAQPIMASYPQTAALRLLFVRRWNLALNVGFRKQPNATLGRNPPYEATGRTARCFDTGSSREALRTRYIVLRASCCKW